MERPAVARSLDSVTPGPAMARYVNRAALPSLAGHESIDNVYLKLRLLSLNYWLDDLKHTNTTGVGHEQEQGQTVG
jgi:hypothetical protein